VDLLNEFNSSANRALLENKPLMHIEVIPIHEIKNTVKEWNSDAAFVMF